MKTPLYDALKAHRGRTSWHTPGHKNGLCAIDPLKSDWGSGFFLDDLTEITGLDNLQNPEGVLKESQDAAAQSLGAAEARYLLGGTSLGILASVYAFCRNDAMIVPRNAHRSVYHACALAHTRPAYLPVAVDKTTGLPIAPDATSLDATLKKAPWCKALCLTYPTYHGYTDYAKEVIALAKARGLFVIVDAAHGAHFFYHPSLPEDALTLGADVVITSLHKCLPVPTQGSLLLLKDEKNAQKLDRALRLLQTTSPSYPIMAAMETALAHYASNGQRLIDGAIRSADLLRQHVQGLQNIRVIDRTQGDPLKVYLASPKVQGTTLARLIEEKGHDVELADSVGVLLFLPAMAYDASVQSLTQALDAIDATLANYEEEKPALPLYRLALPEVSLPLEEALQRPSVKVSPLDARERIAGDFVQVYPPGIPLAVPGEKISEGLALALHQRGFKQITVLAETH